MRSCDVISSFAITNIDNLQRKRMLYSDSEMSSYYQSCNEPEEEDFVDSEDEDIAVVYGRITPYQDEPLAEDDDKENGERKEADLDGLKPAVLEARYEREVSIESQFVFTVILCTHV